MGALAEAPGFVPFSYPEPPYGAVNGAVIENLEFLGWHNPVSSGFDLNSAATVRLSDFYDPDGIMLEFCATLQAGSANADLPVNAEASGGIALLRGLSGLVSRSA